MNYCEPISDYCWCFHQSSIAGWCSKDECVCVPEKMCQHNVCVYCDNAQFNQTTAVAREVVKGQWK